MSKQVGSSEPTQAIRPLTERQRAVMEGIDRRSPIKVIARDLGVSETRINQHIRTLKDIYEADSLGELVEHYRANKAAERKLSAQKEAKRLQEDKGNHKGFSEAVYSNSQVAEAGLVVDVNQTSDPGELVMSDVVLMAEQAPWLGASEPQVVPGVLDGTNAILFRLLAIVGISFGVLAAVVLAVTAAVTISEVLEGRSTASRYDNNFPFRLG